jgi:hypothetical protein
MPRGLSDYDSARIQGRLWTPGLLRPAAWFDASDLSTISIATGVSEWRDKSGNARHMTQATTSIQPPLVPEYKNGLACAQFRMQGGYGANNDRLNMASDLSVQTAYVVVFRQQDTVYPFTVNSFIFTALASYDWHPGYTSTPQTLADGSGTAYASANWRNGSNYNYGSSINVTTYAGIDQWNLFSFLCVGNMATRGIGQDRSFSSSKGYYGEVLWYTDAHSTRDRYLIEGYLSWKWAIPLAADHPFANRPPLIGD